jgi:type III restriction enzyme
MTQMKIKFNPDLDYQKDAVNATLGIFAGQEVRQINFSVPMIKSAQQMDLFSKQSDRGIGNNIELIDE